MKKFVFSVVAKERVATGYDIEIDADTKKDAVRIFNESRDNNTLFTDFDWKGGDVIDILDTYSITIDDIMEKKNGNN